MLTFTWALAVILSLLQIADVWTTNKVLDAGGKELNGMVRVAMDKMGDHWWLIKAPAVIGFVYLAHLYTLTGMATVWVTFLALIALYGYVVKRNYEQWQKQLKTNELKRRR